MPGIDINRFVDLNESLTKHLKCCVCHNIYDNPMDTICGHTFCWLCIETCVQTNGKLCPVCRQTLKSTKRRRHSTPESVVIERDVFVTKNRAFHNIISDLKIKCNYDYKGCEEVIDFGLLSSHLKCCPFRLCSECGLVVAEEHNCMDLLKTSLNELKEKYKQLENQLKAENQCKNEMKVKFNELEKQLETKNESNYEMSNHLNVFYAYYLMNENIEFSVILCEELSQIPVHSSAYSKFHFI